MNTRSRYLLRLLVGVLLVCSVVPLSADEQRPNILFILTDDHRWDGIGSSGNERIHTPHVDRIAKRGVHFRNAFVTLSICSPSRAACLTGRYGSSNGVTALGGRSNLKKGEPTFARALQNTGYRTGVTGKWHLKTTPKECGFDFVSTCRGNGTWYDREFTIDGKTSQRPGFVDDVTADESIRFIRESQERKKPFVLWMCTQVPHSSRGGWPAQEQYLNNYDVDEMPLPKTWNDDLSGKPEYLKTARNRTKALKFGYDKPEAIRKHARDYYAGIQQMDAALGRVLDELERRNLRDNTWIIYMGDNGWLLGEHGMTSKVLPYEESMRVPMAIAGPDTKRLTASDLVLNIDLTATIYELAGVPIPDTLHGRSLLQLCDGKSPKDWRTSFLYEAPTPQLGSEPLWAVRTQRWKYIETQISEDPDDRFAELYDMQADAVEIKNLGREPEQQETVEKLTAQLRCHQKEIASQDARAFNRTADDKLEGIKTRRSNNKDVALPPSEN